MENETLASPGPAHKKSQALLFIGILLIALNLRPALASIGPLVDDIRLDTGLSNLFLGLLTTLPLLAFGIVSVLAPVFTKRFGIGRVLLFAMALLTVGILIRSTSWLPALYIGTVLLGVAIALGNVLLPTLTKQNFSSNSGIVTSVYSSFMGIGASLAAGLSVPLADDLGLGWRGSLRVWAILSVLAFCMWIPQLWRLKRVRSDRDPFKAIKHMVGQRLAWNVAMFMGFQSFTFYVLLAWLPELLVNRDFNTEDAGWLLSLSQATGFLGSLTVPFIAGKKKNQRSTVLFLISFELISLLGLLIPGSGPEWIWVSIAGFVLGGSFGLALLLLVLRSKDTETAAELSGMAQSAGYFIAATGPILIGSLFDLTGSWSYPIAALILIAFIKLYVGMEAGKQGTVKRL